MSVESKQVEDVHRNQYRYPSYELQLCWVDENGRDRNCGVKLCDSFEDVIRAIGSDLMNHPSMAAGPTYQLFFRIRKIISIAYESASGLRYKTAKTEVTFRFPNTLRELADTPDTVVDLSQVTFYKLEPDECQSSVLSTPAQNDSSTNSESASTADESPTSSPDLLSADDSESSPLI